MKLMYFSFIACLLMIPVTSCKKEKELPELKDTGYKSSPLANVLVLEVEEDVVAGYEYKLENSLIPLDSLPVRLNDVFDNQTNSFIIWVGFYNYSFTRFRVAYPGPAYALEFMQLPGDYLPDYYDVIPKERLIHNPAKKALDEEHVKILFVKESSETGWDKTAYWQSLWDKVSDLGVVIQYRNTYPDSDVGFITLEDFDGNKKHYVFLSKSIG